MSSIILVVAVIFFCVTLILFLLKKYFDLQKGVNLFGGAAGFFKKAGGILNFRKDNPFLEGKTEEEAKDMDVFLKKMNGMGEGNSGAEGQINEILQPGPAQEMKQFEGKNFSLKDLKKSRKSQRKNSISKTRKKVVKSVGSSDAGGSGNGEGQGNVGGDAGKFGVGKNVVLLGANSSKRKFVTREGKEVGLSPEQVAKANFNFLMKQLHDESLIKILNYFKENSQPSLEKTIFDRNFTTEEQLILFLRQEIINFLKERHEDYKAKLSGMRRKGKDVKQIALKVMSVPLKIKIFEASFNLDDFYKILVLLMKIDEMFVPFEDTIDKKEKIEDKKDVEKEETTIEENSKEQEKKNGVKTEEKIPENIDEKKIKNLEIQTSKEKKATKKTQKKKIVKKVFKKLKTNKPNKKIKKK